MTHAIRGVLVERPRISSIDIMRGLVMVIMALDHTRDFYHTDAFLFDPTDLSKTTPALFFTRWVTHFCAPTFVFLAGTAIHISAGRKPKNELRKFLITRGLWLILLEIVVVRFGILLNLYYDVIILQVIWAIGVSMLLMAFIIHLKDIYILAFGLVIIFSHNLLDGITISSENIFRAPFMIIHQQGFIPVNDRTGIMVFYPFLPWFGIMMAGFGLGKLYTRDFDVLRPTYLVLAGISTILLFLIIRYLNIYGDPKPWQSYDSLTYTFLSFINCSKYPPSLLYTLMTLGPVLILLGVLEKVNFAFLNPLLVFGRVPLFYYVLHFYILHISALFFFMQKTGKSLDEIDFHFAKGLGGLTAEGGYTLPYVYLAWILVVLFLYPICKWYNEYKSRKKSWWVSYV
jgi:uncharacterized membrane protein